MTNIKEIQNVKSVREFEQTKYYKKILAPKEINFPVVFQLTLLKLKYERLQVVSGNEHQAKQAEIILLDYGKIKDINSDSAQDTWDFCKEKILQKRSRREKRKINKYMLQDILPAIFEGKTESLIQSAFARVVVTFEKFVMDYSSKYSYESYISMVEEILNILFNDLGFIFTPMIRENRMIEYIEPEDSRIRLTESKYFY